MFGESDSESPRVPSPWDTIISTPPSPSPSPLLAAIPKLVPEQDDGNVEYKLQLLSPSPARFARLVTQMKWRLLEGGGQAYYELGVADSGMLVGLPRAELEQSLQTLDAMAGEIGASVIVVKEIEVPAAMADLVAGQADTWNGKRTRRRQAITMLDSTDDSTSTSATETETEPSTTETEDDGDDLSSTVLLEPRGEVFPMDDLDPADANNPQFSIDLEIASVYKPRPTRPPSSSSTHVNPLPPKTKTNKRGTKTKKGKHLPDSLSSSACVPGEQEQPSKAHNRRQARDRRREDRRQALLKYAVSGIEAESNGDADKDRAACAPPDALVSGLEALHVSVEVEPVPVVVAESVIPALELDAVDEGGKKGENVDVEVDDDDDDDVFPSPLTATPLPFTAFASQLTVPVAVSVHSASNLTSSSVIAQGTTTDRADKNDLPLPRLIVEVLVVRKMSLEEAFLDFGFGGFSVGD
ncbi:GTP-binding protein 2 [Favolaschia claudopus]|uniref:GTP-binding protein 2 n=1 Tax=Favolaschia claudopus TaxID=2862362 RepID=A0AAW0DTH1_9AGAR